VLDFGLAKLADPAPDDLTVAGLTAIGRAVGTTAYMSPEQARGERVDGRSDLFSLGLVLYEMMAGRRALSGATTAMVFDALLHRPAPSVREAAPDIPTEVDRIIRRLLAKQPTARYQTASELVTDLYEARRRLDDRSSRTSVQSRIVASVAVLPFVSLSADPENEYLADGITEEVINALGRLKALRVAGRVSSFAFKGRTPELSDVATRLNVSNVLTGSVRKVANRLRITAELVSADDGFQLWSERFDRTADDVFAIQDEIATSIAGQLQVTLSDSGGEPLVRRATANLEAYDRYLKGRFFLNQRGEGIRKGLEAFGQALALDPAFPLAHAGVAEAYSLFGFYGLAPASQAMPTARAAAVRALDLDPSLAEPHAALQIIHFLYDWDWTGSAQEFERAMAKNPNAVSALNFRVVELAMVHGRLDEAIAVGRRAIEIDPLSPYSHVALGSALLIAARYAEANASLKRALEIHPDMWAASRVLGISLSHEGRHDEAMKWLEHSVVSSARHPWTLLNVADALVRAGRTAEAASQAQEILALSREQYVQPTVLGFASSLAVGLDEAFVWFERSAGEHDLLPCLNYFPGVVAVKEDARWQALMRRIGLDPAPI
jgi:TolB-like protein